MKISIVVCGTALLMSVSADNVLAQSSTDMPKIELPSACKSGGEMAGQMPMGQQMMQQMQGMASNMNEANKGYLQAMMAMDPPMMQGAMVPDADIAFNCAMIAHHKGAIEMAKVQLKHGKDEDAKKMAQRTIDQQSKEVEEMTKWVEAHASK